MVSGIEIQICEVEKVAVQTCPICQRRTRRTNVALTCNVMTVSTNISAEHVDSTCQEADAVARGFAGLKWEPARDLLHFSLVALPGLKGPELEKST